MNRVLILSPHPDDEAIGCGGTLRKHVLAGDEVRLIHLTSGELGCRGVSPEETTKLREKEGLAAAAILGIEQVEFWREKDGALGETDSLVSRLLELFETWQPGLIYAPHGAEAHQDHAAAAQIAKRAREELAKKGTQADLRLFEIWTPVQTIKHIENITETIETKIAAVRAYRSQCEIMSFDEAIRGLNRYRGEMHSWPEGEYAEAFTT